MSTYYTINGQQVAEAKIVCPQFGSWEITARLASSDGIVVGQPATFEADSVAQFAGEVAKLSVFSERIRVSIKPKGTALFAKLAPVFLQRITKKALADFVASTIATKANYYAPDGGQMLESATIHAGLNGMQFLGEYFDRVRFSPFSELVIGENITTNSGDFTQQDETSFVDTGLVQLAINNDFLLQPDDFWLYYKVKNVTYQLDASPRITAGVEIVQ